MARANLSALSTDFHLPEGPHLRVGTRLFTGFSPEVVANTTGTRGEVMNRFAEVSGIGEIFVGSPGSPGRARSMFVANHVEKALFGVDHPIPSDFRSITFPRTFDAPDDAESRLLQDPEVRVVCVNTGWPNLAVQRWLDTSINHKPNRGRVGIIGLGNIGENTCNALLSGAAALARHGVDQPLRALNLYRDPRPDFPAKVLEARHVNNPGNVKINEFDPSMTDEFFQKSDVVVFIVSKGIPQLGSESAVGDVRMTQFDTNLTELREYIAKAEKAGFRGTFMVVSDPPEHLATAINRELAERANFGERSGRILGDHQIIANAGLLSIARAEHVINLMDPYQTRELLRDLREYGFVFGAHGRLLVANDVRRGHFDVSLSDVISVATSDENLRVRALGKLPYSAPGHNLALSILELLSGKTAAVSVGTESVVYGVRAALHDIGVFEIKPFLDADAGLVARAVDVHNYIRSTTEIALHRDTEISIPLRPSAFWANGVVTGDALMTTIVPLCSGSGISSWNANVMQKHHFPLAQGKLYVPSSSTKLKSLIEDTMSFLGHDHAYTLADEQSPDEPADESITSKNIAQGAGVVTVKTIRNPQRFPLNLYKEKYPLYLQIDIDIDNPSNAKLIERIEAEGGIVTGFTPRTHVASPTLHFCFIGDRVGIDSEFPCLPLRSSMAGFEAATNHLGHWRDEILPAIRTHIMHGFGLAETDTPGPAQIAPSLREKVTAEGRRIVQGDRVFTSLLEDVGLYHETPTMYEHIIYVRNTAAQLISILKLEDRVDTEIVEKMAILHDLGKAVYLYLNHFVNASRLQEKLCADSLRPINESELGDAATHWRYGRFKQDLLSGTKVQLPANLQPFSHFIDATTGVVSKDTEIAKDILERSDVWTNNQVLLDRLVEFFNHQDNYDEQELYVLVIELADNLSDYGRLSDLSDILKYLGYKEAYALQRYGSSDDAITKIRTKFGKLREAVIKLCGEDEV